MIGQIFLNRGPLSDFHSKILVANAFGIITNPAAEDMHSLKTIRNTFAHAKVPISFDHELVEREVNSLKMLSAMRSTGIAIKLELKMDNKGWFLLITKIILIIFAGLEEHPGTADEALAHILTEEPNSTST